MKSGRQGRRLASWHATLGRRPRLGCRGESLGPAEGLVALTRAHAGGGAGVLQEKPMVELRLLPQSAAGQARLLRPWGPTRGAAQAPVLAAPCHLAGPCRRGGGAGGGLSRHGLVQEPRLGRERRDVPGVARCAPRLQYSDGGGSESASSAARRCSLASQVRRCSPQATTRGT